MFSTANHARILEVPYCRTFVSQQQAAVKGGRRPAQRTLDGCVEGVRHSPTMELAGRVCLFSGIQQDGISVGIEGVRPHNLSHHAATVIARTQTSRCAS
jgi:hypothetical protein